MMESVAIELHNSVRHSTGVVADVPQMQVIKGTNDPAE